MTTTRVAVVTETFYPAVDGTTTTVRATVDRLVDLGHEVLVVAPAPGLATYRGVRVHRVDDSRRTGPQVRAALDAFDPDVVHLTSPRRLGGKALDHARSHGLPTLVVEHSPLVHTSPDHWRRTVARRATRVVVTSRWMHERLTDLDLDVPVWTPGVDPVAFTPALRDRWLHAGWSRRPAGGGDGDDDRVVVGYVGALHRHHGVRRLEALAGLAGVRVVLVGDGPERRRLADRLPGARLLGALQTGDLSVVLPSLDVLVHPGTHQTCAHVLREAAASGVPVVAPAAGAAPEVVRHGTSGLLHDPLDPRGLVGAVDALARDPRRAALGLRGRELVRHRTWTDAVDELLGSHLLPLAGGVEHPRARAPRTASRAG